MSSPRNILNNRYRLDRKIAEGGFAHVFLATDLLLARPVALKILQENWIKDKELLTRFHNEAQAVAALDHPNILPIYDFGTVKGAPYIVMPYVSGGTLADRVSQGPFTLDEIGVYLDQIGSALDYAHEHGIIHRDVKPTNLLMRPNGQLVLMDFGLAKLLQNAELVAKTGVLGTVAYMAPEQYQGLVSCASDIYMLGVLLYQMLAGKLPFEGNTTAMIVAHVHLTPGSLVGQSTMHSLHLSLYLRSHCWAPRMLQLLTHPASHLSLYLRSHCWVPRRPQLLTHPASHLSLYLQGRCCDRRMRR
jgi:serine/threonine protein kinase